MMTAKQMDIFQVFCRKPFGEFTIKQIKHLAGEKSNNALEIAMTRFKEEKLLREKRVGRSALYTLDLDNDLVYYYLALANHQRLGKGAPRTLSILKEKLGRRTQFMALAVFGSTASQEQKKDSDLDVAIVIGDESERRDMEAAARSAGQESLLQLDCHVMTGKEFVEMLTNDEENLGKQIARKHLAVHNHQLFYGLMREGMRHGFAV